ncbi:hypothetical protein [Candidatus Pseudoruminococcus sp.]|uniref:hypothetical protein n=1 Tax=Candidatus Pseudoruminococcus sp. TaxID=3101048 RepID=UPI003999C5CC
MINKSDGWYQELHELVLWIINTKNFSEFIESKIYLLKSEIKDNLDKHIQEYKTNPKTSSKCLSKSINDEKKALTFDRICRLVLADICGVSNENQETLMNKKLSIKQMDKLLFDYINNLN